MADVETGILHHETEIKYLRLKKVRMSKFKVKTMLICYFCIKGIFYYTFVFPKHSDQPVTFKFLQQFCDVHLSKGTISVAWQVNFTS
jgi:hypothetical protein